MSALPSASRSDLPMIPVPVFPQSVNFLPPGGDNPAMLSGKGPATAGRGMQAGHLSAGPLPSQEPLQLISSDDLSKGRGDQPAGDVSNEVAVDPSRLKFWSVEETLELIQLYQKYLPDFHQFGQRKMNVWQRVTEEMGAKGHGNFSWAECSAKFRSLRDSYRRSSAGGRGQTWQYHAVMKEVMRREKLILDQEPATRGQKGATTTTIPGHNHPPSPSPSSLSFPSLAVPHAAVPTPPVPSSAVPNTIMAAAAAPHHPPSTSDDAAGEGTEAGSEEPSHKRGSSDTATPGPAAKKAREGGGGEQEGEVVVVGRNFSGEAVRARARKGGGGVGVLGSLQALGKSLTLPQSQLVVSDDGQIVQTTSTPTGLYVSDTGHLCSGQPGSSSSGGRQTMPSMPQWFKLYEKRTRAENSRRLEELKEMHRDSLALQQQTLEVARHKNQLLKNLMDSLAEFKALLQR